MSRAIKISFKNYPIVAKNSDPTTDIVTLKLDFWIGEYNEIKDAVILTGTQNAINAIDNENPLIISIEDSPDVINHSTLEGNVEVTIDFGDVTDLQETYCIEAFLTDHRGWDSIEPVARQTNYILTESHAAIITEQGDALIFFSPDVM